MKAHNAQVLFSLCLVALFSHASQKPEEDKNNFDIKAHYIKHEYRVPMRDGVKLFTSIYAPTNTSQTYPFLVTRTPYGVAPYGQDKYRSQLGPGGEFDRAGYIFVFQDVRGRYLSEGNFVEMRPHIDSPRAGETDESTDMYDTVEWLLKNVPGNNGKVGIWGVSYPGFYTTASIINSHPAIRAASPEAPMTNLFDGDDVYHNGALMLMANFEFYATYFRIRGGGPELPSSFSDFQYGTTDAYDYFLQHGPSLSKIAEIVQNPLFDENLRHDTEDEYWRSRDISQHLKGIKCPVLTVAGWFDAEDLSGSFRTYRAMGANNPGILNALVVGPWAHGAWTRYRGESLGRVHFNSATAEFYREHIAFPFFEQYLKGKGDAHLHGAYVFETGSNVWRQYDTWPPNNTKRKIIYLHANHKLSFDPPKPDESPFDEYLSDPEHPVPFVAYATTDIPQEYMLGDQRFAAKRPDVLTYVSDPLTEDLTIAGPVSPNLQVATSGTDSDFDVKLIDVYPANYDVTVRGPEQDRVEMDVSVPTEKMGGYQQLIRGEPMRAKFRNSLSKPEPMLPNHVTQVNFEMPDINHTFLHGHRIMVQIQSSWFPLTDLNPQKYIETTAARPADFVKATERVYHTLQAASGIAVGTLP